ncbi:MAG: fibronectin type III domain-containing protein, partial [Gammaproteobacteria bacterium]|nr:fibronectin type III domain-containing protein [Gammaproteobacteria bacterium]
FSDIDLAAGTSYSYRVRATDAAGNFSSYSIVASATTTSPGPGDTTPPDAPANLTATAAGASVINLSWDPSFDNVGVTGYIVRRNGLRVATPVTTSYADTGLLPGTTYRYTVAAFDAAGNNSQLSTGALATTTGTPPKPPPPIPPTLGWYEIPNTQLRAVCADVLFPEVRGSTGCWSVTGAWSGGVMDTARNRLIIWGGGHSNYAGNEVYALNLDTLTLVRLNDPSTPIRDGCSNGRTYADGKPVSRHTYNHLAYLPAQDAMFAWGGSMWQCGTQGDDAWLLNFPSLSWTKISSASGPVGNVFAIGAAYDPNTGFVYATNWTSLSSYNPSTDTWTVRSGAGIGEVAAVIDPVRKKYFMHEASHGSTLYWYDISKPTGSVSLQSAPTTGCSSFLGNGRAYGVGMEYDPVQDRIVGWNGGDTVYILNPDTLSCTTVSYPGGPSAHPLGTYGRFRYSPNLNVFVVCNDVDENCSTLRLTP